ncbi:MAG: N-acetylmuramoyl-L-alanine amidase [Halothiobacillus sp.]|jgi:N-acetylmuramoyl-L-alanine amidase|uniref:N-acetylmuramoyl-L-alanine amidase n=1 Tax=Halothiobacillus sp. TaxID=1891311 RepID=UPI002AD2CA1A|nr:N-acetylmuramoyl-L-alanine amidase [Halothiobacillus sp.]MDA3877518.1 N-acetylmuramoyl-L-alanine amidase [Halothiobacillus sp.]
MFDNSSNPWDRRKFLGAVLGTSTAVFGLVAPDKVLAARVINAVQAARQTDYTRYVFNVNGPLDFKSFSLDNPPRVVIDLTQTQMEHITIPPAPAGSVVSDLRVGIHNGYDLRLVFDMKAPVKPRMLLLPPSDGHGYRFVVDMPHDKSTTLVARDTTDPDSKPQAQAGHTFRDLVIVIDPGHGGKDPGAIGRRGTKEKHIVLDIGRRLHSMVAATPGLRAVMTRDSDRFIHLRGRTAIARKAKADLFVSVHSDAFRVTSARGASVFCLSQGGATSEAARWMANRENEADFVGGASIADHDQDVASVLLDLSQTKTLENSLDFGHRVLSQISGVTDLHSKRVQQAGFVVLKSPDIPSILVESAFISNPIEEARLRTAAYQNEIARSILSGVNTYYAERAPEGTRYAML